MRLRLRSFKKLISSFHVTLHIFKVLQKRVQRTLKTAHFCLIFCGILSFYIIYYSFISSVSFGPHESSPVTLACVWG